MYTIHLLIMPEDVKGLSLRSFRLVIEYPIKNHPTNLQNHPEISLFVLTYPGDNVQSLYVFDNMDEFYYL